MTNEEAKMFLDNLKICINEHPIVADWLVEIADRKTESDSEKPNNSTISKMEQVDKPQTDCGDFADRLAYERGVKHAWEVAQKVFDSTVTFYEAEDVAKQIDKDINVRSKTEQTEREGE